MTSPRNRPAAGVNKEVSTMLARTDTERGQATAEYALVIVAAAAIALALILWASSTGALESFFDAVVAKVTSYV
jgi:Flp pilus assembly pilin Flp